MRRSIHRLAACIITLALLLTLCPLNGIAAASEGTGSIEVTLTCTGCDEAQSMTFGFFLFHPDSSTSYFSIIGSGTHTVTNLAPGTYMLAEEKSGTEVYGYILSAPSVATVTVTAGETSKVSLANTYTVDPNADPIPPAGSLTLNSSVAGGGDAAASLTLIITITAPDGTSTTVNLTGEDSVTLDNLTPGEYTIDVTKDLPGGSFEVSYRDTVTVSPGQNAVDHFSYSFEPSPEETERPPSTPDPDPYETPSPTPEPTPEPTSTPVQTATPAPTPTGTAEPTPAPTSTVTPAQTLEPSSAPIPEHTPGPERTPAPEYMPSPTVTPEHDVTVYIDDRDENIELPVHMLDEIEDVEDAVAAVQELTDRLTEDQKLSHTAIDIATLFAERAAALTAVVDTDAEDEILIDAALLHHVEDTVKQAAGMVGEELENNGVDVDRKLPKTIILYVGNRSSFVAKIDPDVLTTDVDKVRVETDRFAITFKLDDLAVDLEGLTEDEILRFKAEEVEATETGAKPQMLLIAMPQAEGSKIATAKLAVQLTMPESGITNPITLSLSSDASDNQYETMTLNDAATPSKFNPVTITMDSKTTSSGTYTTESNEVDFTDIDGKSAEMQAAIKNLASKGVLVGTTETTFSPDKPIHRSEIATLLVRVLGLYDERAIADYTDVTKADWYYVGAASSQKAKLMSGQGGGKFNGGAIITKGEIIAAGGNVLMEYMDYETPANLDLYLGRFSDDVPTWGRNSIAVATQENIVVYRTDGLFLALSDMTRGDAAIVNNRLFSRIW